MKCTPQKGEKKTDNMPVVTPVELLRAMGPADPGGNRNRDDSNKCFVACTGPEAGRTGRFIMRTGHQGVFFDHYAPSRRNSLFSVDLSQDTMVEMGPSNANGTAAGAAAEEEVEFVMAVGHR